MAIRKELKDPSSELVALCEKGSRQIDSVTTTEKTMAQMIETYLPQEYRPADPADLAAVGNALAEAYDAGWWNCHTNRLF